MHLNKTLLVALFIISTTLVSCKKDYTCSCTATVSLLSSAADNETINIPKTTKKKAESTCNDAEIQLQNKVGASGRASCELK